MEDMVSILVPQALQLKCEQPVDNFVPVLSSKRNALDLKLFGGRGTFAAPLHVGRPNLPNSPIVLMRFKEILDRAWLSNDGPFLKQFEEHLAHTLGVRHCIATCNATTALQLAIVASGLKGQVIVPSFTFAATPHALAWQGIEPVFADIEPKTWTLNPQHVESLITPQTSGILGVHLFGNSCNIMALQQIADKHNLKLLFDASHALGCSYRETSIGQFGCAEIFSFHATKFINAAEGGAVTTNDDQFAAAVRALRSFGTDPDGEIHRVGMNGKMSELSAAMGLTHLEQKQQIIENNRANFETYRSEFHAIPGIAIRTILSHEARNYQYIVAEVDRRESGLSRDQWCAILRAENILVRRYFVPGCHRLAPYASKQGESACALPVTEEALNRVLVFPNGLQVSAVDIRRIADLVRFVVESAPSVRALCQAHQEEVRLALDPPRGTAIRRGP
jgi:dTDP-4-amino-4,6-dideoxygalactose transaminase